MSKQVQDAYIVAATRTPVGKAPKGAFRNTRPDDLLAHALRSVVAQAPGIDLGRIDDAVIGCAMPEGEQGMNVARIGVLLAGLPNTVAAQTINRFCSSGLQAGGAEAVDGLRGHGIRQAGQQHADARDVHALLAFGHGAADHRIVDAAEVDAGGLRDHAAQRVRQQIVGAGVAECAFRCLADRRAGGGDDVGVLDLLAHCSILPSRDS
jgi:Thiolase, N-terminal domain